ncbi:MAG: hypothetical protein ACREGJ_02530 [Candidatus Saccharimonadales bacterium]
MCYTCGCKLPYDDHGDHNNIVEDHLEAAGETEDIKHAGKKSAKENLMELLKTQQEKGELEKPKEDYNE